jgi:uncharacterized membrane protein YqgA involved in biofilm formation
MFIGMGTLVNVATVVIGAGAGLIIGHRLSVSTRNTITASLGLVTLLIAATSAMEVANRDLVDAVGTSAPILIVLGSLVVGAIIGEMLRIEQRIESVGGWLQSRLSRGDVGDGREQFITGFVMSSMVFCVGPLTILGSMNEGVGNGADQLLLKATMDGFAAMAFAASFGIGVMASAISVGAIQGTLTLLGVAVGSFMPDAHLAALSATGGLMLIAVALRLLDVAHIAVANLLPGLVLAPLLCQVAISVA